MNPIQRQCVRCGHARGDHAELLPARCLEEFGSGDVWELCFCEGFRQAVVLSDSILTGIDAVAAMGSSTVEKWYLNQGSDSPDIPERERLDEKKQ